VNTANQLILILTFDNTYLIKFSTNHTTCISLNTGFVMIKELTDFQLSENCPNYND